LLGRLFNFFRICFWGRSLQSCLFLRLDSRFCFR
jgi:hypothetical protein